MSSSAGSTLPSADRRPVKRVAVVTHGRPGQVGDGMQRLVAAARGAGVEVLVGPEEAARNGLPAHDPADAELVVVLGGDGTMLARCAPTSEAGAGARRQLRPRRVSQLGAAGRARDGPRARLLGRSRCRGARHARGRERTESHVAVNDVVVTSGELGRMVELEWAVGGEDLGRVPCDGIICSTPSGSNGLQPLERRSGADVGDRRDGDDVRRPALPARAAPRRAAGQGRPRVEPDAGRPVVVLVDGHRVLEAALGGRVTIRLGAARTRSSRRCRTRPSSAGTGRASRPERTGARREAPV